jgi:hypothetical protein
MVAVMSGFGVFVLATWLPNVPLIWQIVVSRSMSTVDKIQFLIALTGSIGTTFTIFSALSMIATAVLFGANVALTAYYATSRRYAVMPIRKRNVAGGLAGLASGLYGVGCAACGTLAISPFVSLIGLGGLVAAMPFGGEEFSVLGITMLGFSSASLARQIGAPFSCSIEVSGLHDAPDRPTMPAAPKSV